MAQQHLESVRKALETLTAMRRELVDKLAATGQRVNVWQELRDVQETIEALRRAEEDEQGMLSPAERQ